MPEEKFSTHYQRCREFIDEGRASGAVLVHWLVHAYVYLIRVITIIGT